MQDRRHLHQLTTEVKGSINSSSNSLPNNMRITGDSTLEIGVAPTFSLMAFLRCNQETTINSEVDNLLWILLILLSKIGRAGHAYTVPLGYKEKIIPIIIKVWIRETITIQGEAGKKVHTICKTRLTTVDSGRQHKICSTQTDIIRMPQEAIRAILKNTCYLSTV